MNGICQCNKDLVTPFILIPSSQEDGIFSSLRSLRRPWLCSLRDFGPSAILPQGQNTPLREHPVPLTIKYKTVLDKNGLIC